MTSGELLWAQTTASGLIVQGRRGAMSPGRRRSRVRSKVTLSACVCGATSVTRGVPGTAMQAKAPQRCSALSAPFFFGWFDAAAVGRSREVATRQG